MKADYKNWVPRGMILSLLAVALCLAAACLFLSRSELLEAGPLKTALTVLLFLAALVFGTLAIWSVLLYCAFDYRGGRQLSRHIVEGTAAHITLPDGGRCLDVGCGSGALTIAVAKRNPRAEVIGVDRWGKEYASFSRALCQRNAEAERVRNVSFCRGDALHLDFPDGSFDAVTSNYVYHNIPSRDRQAILLETLRTLKKGGVFAIHDIMSAARYGDMEAFVQRLKDMGYRRVELIDTADGVFMKRSEARWMGLGGSALLTGIK